MAFKYELLGVKDGQESWSPARDRKHAVSWAGELSVRWAERDAKSGKTGQSGRVRATKEG